MCLGVLNKDENLSKDMKSIMKFLHTYVPENGHSLVYGDELTVERMHSTLEDMQRSRSHAERLQGLIPVLSDFHAFGRFLEVLSIIAFLLFRKKSSCITKIKKSFAFPMIEVKMHRQTNKH